MEKQQITSKLKLFQNQTLEGLFACPGVSLSEVRAECGTVGPGQATGSPREPLPGITLLLEKCLGFSYGSCEMLPFSPQLLVSQEWNLFLTCHFETSSYTFDSLASLLSFFSCLTCTSEFILCIPVRPLSMLLRAMYANSQMSRIYTSSCNRPVQEGC